jgi:hypothetical protein
MSRKITTYLSLAFAIVLLFTTVAYAHGGDSSFIHACVDPKGAIRIVGANDTCLKKETALDWNIQGPAGAPGPAGSAVSIFPITGNITNNGDPNPIWCHPITPLGGAVSCIPGDLNNFGYRRAIMPMPRSGKLFSLSISMAENNLDGDTEVKVLVNGIDTALLIQVPAGSTSVQMIEAEIPFQVGDFVILVTDGSGASNGGSFFY